MQGELVDDAAAVVRLIWRGLLGLVRLPRRRGVVLREIGLFVVLLGNVTELSVGRYGGVVVCVVAGCVVEVCVVEICVVVLCVVGLAPVVSE